MDGNRALPLEDQLADVEMSGVEARGERRDGEGRHRKVGGGAAVGIGPAAKSPSHEVGV